MAQFKIKQKESVVVEKATFNKAEDFKVVKLLTKKPGSKTPVEGEPKVLHRIQADRLISLGKAVEAKDVKVEAKKSTRTVKTT